MKYCSKCGSANPDDAAFCAQCGTPVEQAPQAPQAPQEPTPATFYSAPAAPAAPQAAAPEAPAPSAYNTDAGSYYTSPAPAAQGTAQSGPVYSAAPTQSNPNTLWLILNIVATVLCCCSFSGIASIIGIVFAAMGMSSFNRGDYEDSAKKANIAKILFIVAIALGVVIYIALIASGVVSKIVNNYYGGF